MAGVPDKIQTWQMVQPTSRDRETKEVTPGKIEKTEIPVPELKPGEALVEDRLRHPGHGRFRSRGRCRKHDDTDCLSNQNR